MPKLLSATYHPNIEVAEFICEDGRHLLRSGGTLPWRINNPGDLTARVVDGVPAPKKAKGYVGFATTRSGRTFLIFPDEDAGRAELKANLKRKHGARTIPEAIPHYAPERENDTAKYIDDLLRTSGIPASRRISDCTDAEIERIVDSISTIEGFHARAETRKETWVAVSRINATDGSQPVPDAEIILQREGGEERLKSDATGRFPAVIHPADKSTVPVKVMSPKTKEPVQVGAIGGETGKDFNLLAKFRKWKGVAGSEKLNSASLGKKTPKSYVVQPGDSLGKIAKLYRTSIAAIKESNGLRSDRIYPGEVLWIAAGDGERSREHKASPPTVNPTTPPSANAGAASVGSPKHSSAPPPIPSTTSGMGPSDFERSKEGAGKILALINPSPNRAPWMPVAIAEAKLRRGETELKLQEKINYHIEINDGLKSLHGDSNAWCAAFVNWCLMQAKYPIDNTGFANRKIAKARAHGFYEVDGPKKKEEKATAKIRNPLFVELEKPIYGCIAMVTSKAGHGHHVGFVYAKNGQNRLVLLGGNQSNQVNFSYFNIIPVAAYTTKNEDGKKVKHNGNPNHLKYFVPAAYYEQAKKDLLDPGLKELNALEINKDMGIEIIKPKTTGPTLK